MQRSVEADVLLLLGHAEAGRRLQELADDEGPDPGPGQGHDDADDLPSAPKPLITPIFPDFFLDFFPFSLDFWLCFLDSWRPDGENGQKMGENG